MKPNLLVVDTLGDGSREIVESVCEELSRDYYVYLARPGSGFREDSPNGVRFVSNPLDALPRFGTLATVWSVGNRSVSTAVRAAYPEADFHDWRPADSPQSPDGFVKALRQRSRTPRLTAVATGRKTAA
ncbi:hypothetical protein HAHE_12540 [Haloferula helveola]|uniref:Uncharacterized protein n=1 Tax=Haloferula helveola TaxID=490095 RepID=A0ABM7RCF3_9BACT|nr:hypothetical protein HAHE_12540 [Haloferula helveola]